MSHERGRMVKPVFAAFAAALVVASLGAAATQLGPWYYALHKPSWQPPDWLFGPAWTLIFGLAAAAGVSAWRHAGTRRARVKIIAAFAINMGLNTLWSLLFFRLHRPDWALFEVGFLWASILVLMGVLWSFSHLASYLLLPYLLWVSFASVLNLAIVRLNAPFS
jgi:tryptophan-rich sensory protein